MQKIAIIGAGVTGLTLGRLLKDDFEVTLLEKETEVGGIARTRNINDCAYHIVGGHCLNSKNKTIMDFIFNEILPKDQWHHVQRNAKIFFNDHLISYPIEFAIKEIAQFDKLLAFNMTQDFLSSKEKPVRNLKDWFMQKFGATLAKEYFIPYNSKIWGMNPEDMDYVWVQDKLPIPNKADFFTALIDDNKDTMPHSTFYYPNSNNQNTFIEALGLGLNVVKNFTVSAIKKNKASWTINHSDEYDMVISTMPLNLTPFLLADTPQNILQHAKKLKFNKVSNMLWDTKPVDDTWRYYPSTDTIFHRHIHIGNFFKPVKTRTITESIGVHSYAEMVQAGRKFDYLLKPLDYNVSEHAYVVYDENHQHSSKAVKDYLNSINLHSVGRFGEWEYYNMDICMQSAMNLAKKIKSRQG